MLGYFLSWIPYQALLLEYCNRHAGDLLDRASGGYCRSQRLMLWQLCCRLLVFALGFAPALSMTLGLGPVHRPTNPQQTPLFPCSSDKTISVSTAWPNCFVWTAAIDESDTRSDNLHNPHIPIIPLIFTMQMWTCLLFGMLQQVEVSIWRISKTDKAPIVIQQRIESKIITCCWNLFILPHSVMGRGATTSQE